MEVVGEAFLSASFQALLGKLGTPESLKFARQEKLDAELRKLEMILRKINAVLKDAEEKQMTSESVKIWLDELRDLAYDVEDILDEFSTEALRRKSKDEPEGSIGLNPKHLMFNVEMGSKINEITTRLQEIAAQKNDLGLREDAGERSGRLTERLPTTSLVNESHVSGREQDKAAILELIKVEASDSQVSVIPIHGMGGVGKTTLAQLVYNDTEVSFDLKAWVCVSEKFDILSITKTVLRSVTDEIPKSDDLNLFQVKLKEKLEGNKFLIVLDDVWNENYDSWTLLRIPFDAGAKGSKIIVTTRNQRVSSKMLSRPTDPAYHLKELSSDDCLSILAQHALGERNFDQHPNLKDTGEKIARRCKGLPLAAKALGGVLRATQNQAEWVDILNSKIWEVDEGNIFPALRLSYHHLPSRLKQCFAYCAIFPKDYEFDRDELVLLWMAEGFLQQSKGNKQMEELGHEYFGNLLSRSFFQQTGSESSRFVMHDLINDLAHFVSGGICFKLEDKLETATFQKVRHSSFSRYEDEVSKRFEVYDELKSLRTFVALPLTPPGHSCHISDQILHSLLLELRCVRVLSLSGYDITKLPNSISELKHLRYLNLSNTKIERLPESVGDLHNLQVLLLRLCYRLTKLPQSIGNLINLRHLDITGINRLQEMPLGIGSLASLRRLSKFDVGKGDGHRIKELKNLSRLQGELWIVGLHNVVDFQDVRVANLKDKHGLDELSMVWGDEHSMIASYTNFKLIWEKEEGEMRNEENETRVLDMLQPHTNLKVLTITFFGGKKLPSWMGNPSFANIVRLHLRGCRRITSLPSLGRLPSLKNLHIEGTGAVKCVGLEFYGLSVKSFPSLETLIFTSMLEWEEWSSSTGVDKQIEGKFPCLRELELVNCPKLIGKLPDHLTSLVKLSICYCPQLVYSLVRLPSLCELKLQECNEVVLRTIADLTLLTTLKISEFTYLHEGLMQFLVALEVLEIEDCYEMTTLWQNRAELENLPCLKQLEIKKCPKLVSFPIPSSLRRLVIKNCEALESFSQIHSSLDNCCCSSNSNICLLEDVEIEGCPSLKSFPTAKIVCLTISCCDALESFPESGLPIPNLRSLHVSDCISLKSLPNQIQSLTSLQDLSIWGCPNIVSIPKGGFPPNLTSLYIGNCENLKQPMSEWGLQRLTSLRRFTINGGCAALQDMVSFPDDEHDCSLPTTLTYLEITRFPNLETLSRRLQNLTSLEELRIWWCPTLQSLPDEGLPATLELLSILSCPLLKQRCLREVGEYWPIIAHIPRVYIY